MKGGDFALLLTIRAGSVITSESVTLEWRIADARATEDVQRPRSLAVPFRPILARSHPEQAVGGETDVDRHRARGGSG
jgi:hypothetical protein